MLLMLLAAEESSHRARMAQTLDEELFTRMANGQTAALEKVYVQTNSAVYGFALSILKNAQDAQDVMQDTYVTLYRKAGDYHPQGKPMAWVLTIARNLALMQLRRRRHEADPAIEVEDPAAFEADSVNRLILKTALAILSDEERQIVILHCVTGLKHREIAELLGLPLGTTLSKYKRALAKLQKQLREEEAS